MSVLEFEVGVEAPPERVWEVVADPNHLPRWDRHISKVTGAPTGGLRTGSTYSTEMVFLGARANVRATVVVWLPEPSTHVTETRSPGLWT